ncbi:UDP-N-acetylmuramate--L-alanine ligase [Bacteroides sp.]|uniref:UDP-N-acetylmuramate--L-alanine ligase n=1 Tax=Bacteroides sp. TaxID=29523 RepID=UPI00258E3394|nr:UDP-N-acetylmuramate--L-alanine ligase [Bacteroides sp.]
MKIENIKSVYFIGAGGIGMSALVRYFLSLGKAVAGYDRTPSELTKQLIHEGANIHYSDDLTLIPEIFKVKENTLVVYTPAVPHTHSELTFFIQQDYSVMKRSQVLGLITRSSRGLCVAGTHGKTTTSTLIAHLLHESSIGCTAFLGGISENYNTNLLLSKKSPYTVIEADEFDRSFHALHPFISVITSADPDHLDIYGTQEAYFESFEHYTSLIDSDGILVIRKGLKIHPRLKEGVKTYTYSAHEGDFHAENIIIENGEIFMDFVGPNIRINNIQLGVPISINIENSVAALAVAHLCAVKDQELKKAMGTFKGVERRFDFVLKNDKHVLINDYAHHPAEIKQSIISIKELYPKRKLTTVFQPHLYTRTKDFYKDFAESLSLSDEVILLDIYPAREEPIEGVTSMLIYSNLRNSVIKHTATKENIVNLLSTLSTDIVLTLGAGDINQLLPQIKVTLES